jgi:hypothetical protein
MYTKCQFCLRTVPVTKGKLNYHIPDTWAKKACQGHGTDALWVEGNRLNAFGRNTQGECMRCGETKTNPDCPQCSYKKRAEDVRRRKGRD